MRRTTTRKNARGLVASVTNALNKTATYAYDAVGDLVTATDSAGNVTTYSYDVRGSKIASSDPDMGHWTYQYDAFGSLYSQTDAKGQMAVVSYDPLGRAVKRTEADLVSQWIYGNDPALDNVGKLIEACTGSCAGSDYQRSHTYDGVGRPLGAMLSIAGTAGVYTLGYEPGDGARLDAELSVGSEGPVQLRSHAGLPARDHRHRHGPGAVDGERARRGDAPAAIDRRGWGLNDPILRSGDRIARADPRLRRRQRRRQRCELPVRLRQQRDADAAHGFAGRLHRELLQRRAEPTDGIGGGQSGQHELHGGAHREVGRL